MFSICYVTRLRICISSPSVKSIDVANEHCASRWFEAQTSDDEIVYDSYDTVHTEDPDAKLFLNQYNLVKNSEYTQVGGVFNAMSIYV